VGAAGEIVDAVEALLVGRDPNQWWPTEKGRKGVRADYRKRHKEGEEEVREATAGDAGERCSRVGLLGIPAILKRQEKLIGCYCRVCAKHRTPITKLDMNKSEP
jgi:hypothetical protein